MNSVLEGLIRGLPGGPTPITSRRSRASREPVTPATITIEGETASAVSPEGKTAQMPLKELIERLAPQGLHTGDLVLPDGVKSVFSRGPVTVLVYESLPNAYRLKWIAADSPAPYGPGTTYRSVRLALPYVIVLAVFARSPAGRLRLTNTNECFFRTAPLRHLDDGLLYPGLLNCSRFDPPDGRPLSWICTQHLESRGEMLEADPGRAIPGGLEALRRCLMETGFNYSSEEHEASSWFTESRKVDPRIRTVEAWEKASLEDELFALNVPWIQTDHSLGSVVERIFARLNAVPPRTGQAAVMARYIFNYRPHPNPKPKPDPEPQVQAQLFHPFE